MTASCGRTRLRTFTQRSRRRRWQACRTRELMTSIELARVTTYWLCEASSILQVEAAALLPRTQGQVRERKLEGKGGSAETQRPRGGYKTSKALRSGRLHEGLVYSSSGGGR